MDLKDFQNVYFIPIHNYIKYRCENNAKLQKCYWDKWVSFLEFAGLLPQLYYYYIVASKL